MRNKRKVLRVTVLGIIFLALGGAFYTAYINQDTSVQVGDKAPNFKLSTLDGHTVKLSDYRGKKGVLINFWATYCSPCREEMPYMEEQFEQFKDQGIEILAVNVGEPELTVRSFAKRLNLTFPILLDADKSVTNQYQITPIPTSFFVDKDGIVVAKKEQMMDRIQIAQYLHKIKP